LTCVGARFRGPVNFGSLRCEGPGWFNYAWFENKETVDFTFTYFGGSLSLETVNFAGPVDMYMAHISRGLILRNAEFQQGLTLYAATTERLVLGEPGNEFSFSFDGRLDLREFTFRMISGSKQQAERFVRAQDPTTFSMFPYIQLEQHYRNIGDGAEARSIYYCARNDRRRFAKEANDSTNWTLGRRWSDSAYKWFVGYGVKPARLLSLIFIFTLLGMIVYWPDYALVPVESTVPSGGEAPPGGEFGTSFTEKVTSRLAYSVDLLVPSANVYGITFGELGISEGLSPNGRLPQLYAGLHQTIGYLLIGLFIAIYTGVLRRF
jgi:hypothetical protein